MSGSKWDRIKKFVNETKEFHIKDIGGESEKTYINYLYQAGFLCKPKKGYYKLIIEISDDVTLYNITEYAYGKKKGIMTKLIRKAKLKKLYDKDEEEGH